jgi:MoxR-like ATPase
MASRARAFMQGRTFVIPEDVKAVAPDALRHRLILTYEADAEQVTGDHIVKYILDTLEVP